MTAAFQYLFNQVAKEKVGAFLKERLLSGQVRDDIFDYGRGLADGAISVGKGVYNLGRQAARHFGGDPSAQLENQAVDRAVEVYVTNPTARSQVNKQIYNQATNLDNYTAYNIGRVVGRSITGVLTRPAGLVAVGGDGITQVERGGSVLGGLILGAE